MRRHPGLAAAFILLLAGPLTASAQQQGPQNLQVLPKTLSRAEVTVRMREIAGALGVECGYCHVARAGSTPQPGQRPDMDYAADAKPAKERAREMLRMTMRINEELLPAAVHGEPSVHVGCVTCHRGAPRPVLLEDTIHAVVAQLGVDSALAEYGRLQARYGSGFAYNFGDAPLITMATRLSGEQRAQDARRILEYAAERRPESSNVAFELGRLYEAQGEKALAIEQYRRVLKLQPENQQAQRRLQALTGG